MPKTTDNEALKEVYNSKERSRLRQIARFLSNISEPSIGLRAVLHGYDGEEHKYGWKQYGLAMGMDRPFEHFLSVAESKALLKASSATVERYGTLDKFENTWFPRVRTTIERFVKADKREVFLAAFFKDLKQQAQGPAVVSSVELFLQRIEAMPQSDTPGAAKAHAALVKKGLSAELCQHIKDTIAEAKKEAAPVEPSRVSPDEITAATQRQREAYENLRLWYNDWSATLRTELSYHQLVRLGLASQKGMRRAAEPETEVEVDHLVPESLVDAAPPMPN